MPTDEKSLADQIEALKQLRVLDNERFEDRISSLKELINSNIQAVKESSALALSASKEAINAAFAASKEAINKAENAATDKAHDMNEWRATMTDLVTKYMLRNEAGDKFDAQSELIRALQSKVADTESSKHGQSNLWGYIVGAIGVLAMLWDKLK